MSVYPPPLVFPLPPVFNSAYFTSFTDALTLQITDARYLKLVGGTITGPLYSTSRIFLSNGTVSNPALSFSTSTNTGIYLGSGHHINFSSLGAQRFHVADDHIRCYEPLRLNEADNPCLTFQGDQDSGLRWQANDDYRFTCNSKDMLRIQNSFVSVLSHPFLIAHSVVGTDPSQFYTGFQATTGQRNETQVIQECGTGLRALKFVPNHFGAAAADVLFRFQNIGATQEIQISNQLQMLLNNGTASRPSLSFQSSVSSGIHWNTTAPTGMVFIHGTGERMRVTGTGVRIAPDAAGTEIRGIRVGRVAAGSGTGSESFTPAFAAGTNVRVIANIESNSTSQIFSVNIHTISNTGFSWVRNFYSFTSNNGGQATGEPFSWVAFVV